MEIDVKNISGIGAYETRVENEGSEENKKERTLYLVGEKVFLVVRNNTIEVRCDDKLSKVLRDKYESVIILLLIRSSITHKRKMKKRSQ